MKHRVWISRELHLTAKTEAAKSNRTTSDQIHYWVKVGRTSIDNPDLPISFIIDVIAAMAEPASEKIPYIPGSLRAR